MDLNTIRKMTDQERTAELARMKQELFNLVKMREIRRDIARVKTIIREMDKPEA